MSLADDSLRFCQMFEGEFLIELMLRYWHHPLAGESEYRNDLIESAADVIRASINGERLLEDLPPSQMNLVTAVWYAEWAGLQGGSSEIPDGELREREAWLEEVRRSVPLCFCDQNDLPS